MIPSLSAPYSLVTETCDRHVSLLFTTTCRQRPQTERLMSSGKSPPGMFPELPSRPGPAPWPADIIDGHNTLKAVHKAASQALGLDDSDPIRLRHYEKQVKTTMPSTLQALAACENPSLPECYINAVTNVIRALVGSVALALTSSLRQ